MTTDPAGTSVAIDPVCGMKVNPAAPRGGSFEFDGQTYYFCSPGCRAKFAADPATWLKTGPKGMHHAVAQPLPLTVRKKEAAVPPGAPAVPPPAAGAKTIWICPMDPEVRQDHPGDCPICGMALEPEVPTAGAVAQDAELQNMTQRFWVAAALALPLLIIVMSGMAPDSAVRHMIPMSARPWIEFALATPVCRGIL